MLAAGDTFRAAAIEQLGYGPAAPGRILSPRKPGGDAAGLAFEALERRAPKGSDVLLIDTAGRLAEQGG